MIDADIYWPILRVNILTRFRKKRKGVILIVEGRESEDSEVGADCICKRVRDLTKDHGGGLQNVTGVDPKHPLCSLKILVLGFLILFSKTFFFRGSVHFKSTGAGENYRPPPPSHL